MTPLDTAREVAGLLIGLPGVRAVALGGSEAAGSADAQSDIDLYVYADAEVHPDRRRALILPRAARAEVDNRVWETGDEWLERESGIHTDVMYRSLAWIEAQLDQVLHKHEASLGYTTSLWHNVLTCTALQDPTDWLVQLKSDADQPYPEPLAHAIIAKNHPLLRSAISSFESQFAKATARRDLVSMNHRAAALLASYFDVMFALNRRPHPGEKRLLQHASVLPEKPVEMERHIAAFLEGIGSNNALQALELLIDGLDALLIRHGAMPTRTPLA